MSTQTPRHVIHQLAGGIPAHIERLTSQPHTSRRRVLKSVLATVSGLGLDVTSTQPLFASSPANPPGGSGWQVSPPNWNMGWVAAVKNSQTNPCWLTVVGDSVAQGLVCSDIMTNSWFALLRNSLQSRFGWFADFYSAAQSATFLDAAGFPYDKPLPWSLVPAPSLRRVPGGYGFIPLYGADRSGTLATYVSPTPCAGLDIIWGNRYGPEGSSWEFRVDGSQRQTVTNPPLGLYPYRLLIYGLDPKQTHALEFSNQTADSVWDIWGVASYSATGTGIGFAQFANAGDCVRAWNPSKFDPLGREFLLQGPSYVGATGFGFPAGPNLAIISLGGNDAILGTPLAAYTDGLQAFVQAVRDNLPIASILFVADNLPAIGLDPHSPLTQATATYPIYVTAMRSVAAKYGCTFLDFHAKWGANSIAAGLTATNGHPTDRGHKDMAASILDVLGT